MLIFPNYRALIKLDPKTLQIWNIESLEILFIRCPHNNLLFLFIYFQAVDLFGPFEISYAPLKSLSSVFSNEDWLKDIRGNHLLHYHLKEPKDLLLD
jgi:hypothetical protein